MARKTITLAEVGLRQEKPGKNGMYSLLDVKGTDGLKYTLFKTAFMDLCKVGATLDAEVKEEQKEWQGNQFTNYTITEVYLDGQAVAGSKQGGGGRSYGKSPDERASIERQVAVKEVGEALRMGLPVTPEIQGAYWRIVAEWLNAPQSAPAGQGAASASNPIPTGQSGANFRADRDGYRIVIPTDIPQPRTSRDDAAEMDTAFAVAQAARQFATLSEFLAAAKEEFGLPPDKIGDYLTSAELRDKAEAWNILAKKMRERHE